MELLLSVCMLVGVCWATPEQRCWLGEACIAVRRWRWDVEARTGGCTWYPLTRSRHSVDPVLTSFPLPLHAGYAGTGYVRLLSLQAVFNVVRFAAMLSMFVVQQHSSTIELPQLPTRLMVRAAATCAEALLGDSMMEIHPQLVEPTSASASASTSSTAASASAAAAAASPDDIHDDDAAPPPEQTDFSVSNLTVDNNTTTAPPGRTGDILPSTPPCTDARAEASYVVKAKKPRTAPPICRHGRSRLPEMDRIFQRGRSLGRSLDTDDITVRRRRAVPHAARGASSSAAATARGGHAALYMHDDIMHPVARRRMPSPMARRGFTLGDAHTTTTSTVLNLHTANGWGSQGGAAATGGLARARAQAAETLQRLGRTSPAVGQAPSRSHRTALRVLKDGAAAAATKKAAALGESGGKAAAEAAGRVTGTAEAVGSSTGKTHTVEAGETLYSLATAHNTSVAAMQHLNNLAGDSILVGR